MGIQIEQHLTLRSNCPCLMNDVAHKMFCLKCTTTTTTTTTATTTATTTTALA